MKKKINALQVTLKKIDALAKKFHTWKKLRKKIRRLENSHPSIALRDSSFNRKVMYPDVGPFSLPRLQGHSVEIKETWTFEL